VANIRKSDEEMNVALLQKIEEVILYDIELKKEIEDLERKIPDN